MSIAIISQKDIDKLKWDHCVHNATNGLIYATSIYLDHLCPEWYGIVKDDYEAVMPLCSKQKFGIKYLYQPAFCQQGGIFGENENIGVLEGEFSAQLRKHWKFAEINLNYGHQAGKVFPLVRTANNFIRDLRVTTYSNYINERLRRLQKFELRIQSCENIPRIVKDYRLLYGERFPNVKDQDYQGFINLAMLLKTEGRVIMREVVDNNNTVLASCLLLKDQRRIYNLISNLFPEGRTKLANYFMYDRLFKEHRDSGLLFDFEGSDLEGVKYFYKKFATANQTFPVIKINDLPAPLKWLKS